MLTLTENASAIVNEITSQPGLAETAGLRITSDASPEPAFEVTAAAQGEPGDQVVEQAGATVYLDETAAQLLDDKVLDAAVDRLGQGRVRARPPGLSPRTRVRAPDHTVRGPWSFPAAGRIDP